MGFMVDWLACCARSFNENGTSSKNQPFSRDVRSFSQKFVSQKSHENAQEKSLRV